MTTARWTIVGTVFVLLAAAFVTMPDGVAMDAKAETWEQATDEDFEAGEMVAVESVDGTLQLTRGLDLLWSDTGGGADERFGKSLSSAGDVNGDGYDDVIISAPYHDDGGMNSGMACVYHGGAEGPEDLTAWSFLGKHEFDYFGWSVSGAGDLNGDGFDDVIVGADYFDAIGNEAGKVYVFHGSSGGLSETPDWTHTGESAGDMFGKSVSGAGDVNGDGFDDVIVGADGRDGLVDLEIGGAYVFHGSADGLSSSPDWWADGEGANDLFGSSVSGAGDVNGDGYDDVIVGSPGNRDAGYATGKSYVYHGSSTGLSGTPDWTEEGKASYVAFGTCVSNAGDVNGDGYGDIVVGAPNHGGGTSGPGETLVYLGSSGGLGPTPDWSHQGSSPSDHFGYSVSHAGDVNGDGYGDIVVGAWGDGPGSSNRGKAYVHFGSIHGLSDSPSWVEMGNSVYGEFGFSVSGAGDVNADGYDDVLVGEQKNPESGLDAGKAHLYSIPSEPIVPSWYEGGGAYEDAFGCSVSCAGDVNGDGYDDLIVGSYGDKSSGAYTGEARIYHGSPGGLSATPDWSEQGESKGDRFGYCVSGAGDVNGDGYDDVLVGAPRRSEGGSAAGKTYMYLGSSNGLSGSPDWSDLGESAHDWFGISLSGAGDVNGDGYDDVIVSAEGNDDGGSLAGKAYVYLGTPAGLSDSPVWSDQGEAADDRYGGSVSGAGDVNGDGYDDIIIGSQLNDDGGTSAGEAYVYSGSSSGPGASPDWSDQGENAYIHFGSSVSCAGDVNGDGYDDVIVGSKFAFDNGLPRGAAYIYYGSSGGLSASPDWSDLGEAPHGEFGHSVSGAGDVNADGYDDVIIGGPRNLDSEIKPGDAFVYFGSPNGPGTSPDWSTSGEEYEDYFGYSVSGAGDVYGDGGDDVVVGAPYFFNNHEGEVYLYSSAPHMISGHFISETFTPEDIDVVVWESISWEAVTEPGVTSVKCQIATNDDGLTWDFVGPDGTADTYYTSAEGEGIYSDQSGSQIRVKFYLSTSKVGITPKLSEFTLIYTANWKDYFDDKVDDLDDAKTGEKKLDDKLEKAIEAIEDSFDDALWTEQGVLDPDDGDKAFKAWEDAVKELHKIIDEDAKGKLDVSDSTLELCQEMIDSLVEMAEQYANDAYEAALEYAGASQKVDDEIAKCEDELDKAQDEIVDEKYDKAIDKFKKAWEHAQKAIEEGEKVS